MCAMNQPVRRLSAQGRRRRRVRPCAIALASLLAAGYLVPPATLRAGDARPAPAEPNTRPAARRPSTDSRPEGSPQAAQTQRALSARESDDLEGLWKSLADGDKAASLQAVTAMAEQGGPAVAFLRKKLAPIPAYDAAAVQRLIGQLDSSEYAVRERATEELSRIGISIEETLRKAMESTKSVEVRTRLDQLFKSAYAPVPTDPAGRRWLRAIRALERIGSPDARALLGELAKGAPQARATQQAQEALRHLGRAAKTDSPTWWLARAEEEAEIEDDIHPFPYALAEISCLLSDAGLIEAADAMERRASEVGARLEARYHLAAAYARAGQVKAAHDVAAEINFPDGRTEVNCRIGIALASVGWVEPNVAYTQPSADWIAATVAHPPDARQADKWKVPEGLTFSAQARIHAAIALAHAAAGRKELYRKDLALAQALIDKIPGDIAEMQRRLISSDSRVAGAPGPDPMNGIYKTLAIEAVAMAHARAGDCEGARTVLQQLPAGRIRDGRAMILAKDLAGRGELKEARTTADAIQHKTHRNLALFAIIGACLRTGDRAGAQAAADKVQVDENDSPVGGLRSEGYQTAARLALRPETGGDQDYQAVARYEITIRWLARAQAQTPGRNRDDIFKWIMTLPKAPSRFQAMLGVAEGVLATQAKSPAAPAATRPATAPAGK